MNQTNSLLGGALVMTMYPRSLKSRIEARRIQQAIIAGLPEESDSTVKAALTDAAAEYATLKTHTESVVLVGDNPHAAAFVAWWNQAVDPVAHFDGYIGLADGLLMDWWQAYEAANVLHLPIESKPPSTLSDDERAALNDPKATPTSAVGSGKPNS